MRYVDVRIGNDTTPTGTDIAETNERCQYKTSEPSRFEFVVFTCPSPGIVGKVITIQKHHSSSLQFGEVQIYGKQLKVDIFYPNI